MSNPSKIGDIVDTLEQNFPLNTQDNWDNSGLIIGCREWDVKGVLLTVDITSERVDEAISKGCNLIIAHHPILFRGIKRINGNSDEELTIIKAIKNDIAICAFHTPADKAKQGLSYQLGKEIGLTDMQVMVQENNGIGYGVVGTLQQPLTSDKFIEQLRDKTLCPCIRHNDYRGEICRVAVCTGSGSEFIGDALRLGADAYVTGDVKYHQFQQGGSSMMIADVGHYESEEMSKKLFFELLTEKFSNFAVCISDTCQNVVKYN